MSKQFEVEDRVRVINQGSFYTGEIGTIKEIMSDQEIFVEIDNVHGRYLVKSGDLELLIKPKMHPIYELEMMERWDENSFSGWQRIPGGWMVFNAVFKTTTFIPFNNEFMNARHE